MLSVVVLLLVIAAVAIVIAAHSRHHAGTKSAAGKPAMYVVGGCTRCHGGR